MDPLVELLKGVDLPIAAALGIIVTLVFDQVVPGLLNCERVFWWKSPIYHWDTDRVMPVLTLLIGGAYGWSTGKGTGHLDNIRQGLLYGAVALALARVFRKTLLGR